MATVAVERVDHLEEAPLETGRLGGGVERRRARVLAGDREMSENEPARLFLQALPDTGAAGTAEVGVDDQALLPIAADVILRLDGWDRGAGEIVAQEARASKMTLAPGISPGLSASWVQATLPPSSTRTSVRLAKPIFST